MKKLFVLLSIILMTCALNAQELQIHYDFAEEREYPTIKFRMLRPDNFGYTYINTEFDFPKFKDMERSYVDITRNLRLGESAWSIRGEYNGGLYKEGKYPGHVNNAWVAGVSYGLGDENVHFEVFGAYRYIMNTDNSNNFHAGAVAWFDLFDGFMSFFGFVDFWTEDKFDDGRLWVCHAEPQLWINLAENVAVGTEFELTNNYYGESSDFYPTVGLKIKF